MKTKSILKISDIPTLTGAGERACPWIPARDSDVWNDEFDSGSPDLALRGWTVEAWSTGVAMTRVGDVSWHAGAAIGSAEYRSTIVGSELWIQTPVGISVFLSKATSGQRLFAVKMLPVFPQAGIECKLWSYNDTRVPATPERSAYGTGHIATGAATGIMQFIYTNNAGTQAYNTSGNTFNTADVPQDIFTHDLRSVNLAAHATWNSATLRSRWQRQHSGAASSCVRCGVQVVTDGAGSLSGNALLRAIAIDWIRTDAGAVL